MLHWVLLFPSCTSLMLNCSASVRTFKRSRRHWRQLFSLNLDLKRQVLFCNHKESLLTKVTSTVAKSCKTTLIRNYNASFDSVNISLKVYLMQNFSEKISLKSVQSYNNVWKKMVRMILSFVQSPVSSEWKILIYKVVQKKKKKESAKKVWYNA